MCRESFILLLLPMPALSPVTLPGREEAGGLPMPPLPGDAFLHEHSTTTTMPCLYACPLWWKFSTPHLEVFGEEHCRWPATFLPAFSSGWVTF